jgi:hypothetical protein
MARRDGLEFTDAAIGEIEAVIGKSPEMVAAMTAMGNAVKAFAEHEAEPIGHRHPGQGSGPAYKDSFSVLAVPSGAVTAVVVSSSAYDAVWVELGSHPGGGTTAAEGYHVLQHALTAVMGAAQTKLGKQTGIGVRKSAKKSKTAKVESHKSTGGRG